MIDQKVTSLASYGKAVKYLRRKVQRRVDTGSIQGASTSTAISNDPILLEGFRYRGLSKSGQVDTQTLFQIGSTTELFTGLSFMFECDSEGRESALVDAFYEFSSLRPRRLVGISESFLIA